MPMKPLPHLIICLAALTLPLMAQEPVKPKIIPSLATTGSGPLDELIETLRKETGVDIIVEAGLAQQTPAPKLLLTNVTAASVMQVLGALIPTISIKTQGVPPQETYTITSRTELPAQVFQRVTRIFKAGGAGLSSADFDKLLESITTISDIAAMTSGRMHNEISFANCKANINCTQCHAPGRNDALFRDCKPIIEAHRPTGIIIVSGTEDKVQLVEQVIKVLGGESMPRGGDAAPSAAVRNSTIPVKYLEAAEALEKIKTDLGASAAAAVISTDPHTNSLMFNDAHPDAVRVRLFLERLDERPMTVVVKTEVRREDAAHPKGMVIANPTLAMLPGKTADITVGNVGEQITIKLTVTPEGTENGLAAAAMRVRDEAEKERQEHDANVQKLEDVLKQAQPGSAPTAPPPASPK
jgi:hypothetical protein